MLQSEMVVNIMTSNFDALIAKWKRLIGKSDSKEVHVRYMSYLRQVHVRTMSDPVRPRSPFR